MTAEEIVRKLANIPCEPIEGETGRCTLCDEFTQCRSRADDHADDCPWRLAKEFVSQAPSEQQAPS